MEIYENMKYTVWKYLGNVVPYSPLNIRTTMVYRWIMLASFCLIDDTFRHCSKD